MVKFICEIQYYDLTASGVTVAKSWWDNGKSLLTYTWSISPPLMWVGSDTGCTKLKLCMNDPTNKSLWKSTLKSFVVHYKQTFEFILVVIAKNIAWFQNIS